MECTLAIVYLCKGGGGWICIVGWLVSISLS